MHKYITPRATLLLGILMGTVLQLPYILWLQRTPSVIAEPISESIYNQMEKKQFVMKNVSAWFPFRNTNLRITVASSEEVNKRARQVYTMKEDEELAGFYDPIEHEIWCVNSVEVLIHELRHVFEGAFHRDLKLLLTRKY